MNAFLRLLLVTAAVSLPLALLAPAPAAADDYWDGYWSWYDGTYRPYYHRQYYYSSPYYGRSYSYYPRDYYYGRPSYGPPYGRAYGYYGAPLRADVDVRVGPVGPITFGWR